METQKRIAKSKSSSLGEVTSPFHMGGRHGSLQCSEFALRLRRQERTRRTFQDCTFRPVHFKPHSETQLTIASFLSDPTTTKSTMKEDGDSTKVTKRVKPPRASAPTRLPDESTPGLMDAPSGIDPEEWEQHVRAALELSKTSDKRVLAKLEGIVRLHPEPFVASRVLTRSTGTQRDSDDQGKNT